MISGLAAIIDLVFPLYALAGESRYSQCRLVEIKYLISLRRQKKGVVFVLPLHPKLSRQY